MPGTRSSKQSLKSNVSQAHPPEARPQPPFTWAGCNLGLGGDIEPLVHFVDGAGQRWETRSVEFILANIDLFLGERDRQRLLAGAALHYGLDDVWILIKGRGA